jgi:Coenzyme PQQ synthesis protein D (PqqD)
MTEGYIIQNPDAAWRVYDGEAVILCAEDSTLNTLNPVGTLIWEAADGRTPLSQIVAQICDQFDVDPARAARDSTAFIEDLCRRRLLSLSAMPKTEP